MTLEVEGASPSASPRDRMCCMEETLEELYFSLVLRLYQELSDTRATVSQLRQALRDKEEHAGRPHESEPGAWESTTSLLAAVDEFVYAYERCTFEPPWTCDKVHDAAAALVELVYARDLARAGT